MMKHSVTLLAAGMLVVLMSWTFVAAEPLDMKPGEWSITMKVNMEGVPFAMPPITVKQCLTEKDFVPKPAVSPQQGKGPNCEITDQKIDGNTVSWSISCADERGTTKGKGSLTYSGTTFVGSSEVTMTGGGESSIVKTDMSGKWIGPCKK
ncbi:MAG: DUF3617 domain-containing protein [Vicinamibacteria bacterium]|nr:DUF3617 domain-containing protein [Vicinamibacteria bacterium]